MRYIQLVDFRSSHPADEVRAALDAWLAATRGKRTLQTAILAVEHDRPTQYWELLEYSSEEEAKRSNELPETKGAFDRWIALVDGEPVFRNLDVVEHVEG